MITFIKNDRYISFLNFIIVIVFLIFNVSYIWFLLIELTIITLFLIFMLYRFYLRSSIKEKDLNKIKKLYKLKFNYEDYKDVYEEEEDFDLEIKGYKKLLDVVIVNILRMDNKLDILDYSTLDKGLEILEKSVKRNKKRKENYELVIEVVNIIKKHYDKKCNRKDNILKHIKLLIVEIVLTVIYLLFLVIYFINNNIAFYSIAVSIYIFILIVVNILFSNFNKDILKAQ